MKIEVEVKLHSSVLELFNRVLNNIPTTAPKAAEPQGPPVEKKPKKASTPTVTDDPAPEVQPSPAPGTNSLTMEDVRERAMAKTKENKRVELKRLLDEFNVEKVTQLPESDYERFYNALGDL